MLQGNIFISFFLPTSSLVTIGASITPGDDAVKLSEWPENLRKLTKNTRIYDLG